MAEQKQDDQLEHTYSSYVRIRDVALKTCPRRWMIGRSGERRSGISVLAARHDDDDDAILLQWWIWHLITHESWYTIKTKKPNQAIFSAIYFPEYVFYFLNRGKLNRLSVASYKLPGSASIAVSKRRMLNKLRYSDITYLYTEGSFYH